MSWKQIQLGDLFEQYRIQDIVEDDKDYGQITISKNGYIKFRTTKNGKTIGRKRQFIIDLETYPNTCLFTRQGVAEGAIAFAPKEVNGCIATENMPMFSLKEGISKKFVELLLKSEQYKNEVKKLIPSGSAQKSIHERDLMKISLQIPDEEKQKKLSEVIDSRLKNLDILKTEIIHQQTLLKKIRQSILQEAIEGKLTASWRKENQNIESASVLLEKIKAEKEELIKAKKIKKQKPLESIKKDEIPFEIPDGWVWCRFGRVINKYEAGKSFKCFDRTIEKSEEWGILKTSAVTSGKFIESEHKFYVDKIPSDISKKIKLNDLIFCRASGSKGLAGKCVIIKNYSKNLLLSDKTPRLLVSQYINKEFIFFHNETNYSKDYYNSLNIGKSTSMNNITKEQLFLKSFPLPPLKEQKQIVKKIESLFKICDELETQINTSKENTQRLMQSVLKDAFENK